MLSDAQRPFKICCASPSITSQLVLFLWQTVEMDPLGHVRVVETLQNVVQKCDPLIVCYNNRLFCSVLSACNVVPGEHRVFLGLVQLLFWCSAFRKRKLSSEMHFNQHSIINDTKSRSSINTGSGDGNWTINAFSSCQKSCWQMLDISLERALSHFWEHLSIIVYLI